MPIIDMPVEMLLARVNRAGERRQLGIDDVVDVLPKLGCELEELADMQEYVCQVCGRIYDRTEAQGPPLNCSNCGADFRTFPDQLTDLGTSKVLRIDMLAVRPDIFDPGGMARYVRGFLGTQTGLVEYVLSAAKIKVQVDPNLAHEDSYRPHISCAVVRNVQLDSNTIKMVMNLQEDLHWALGRDRKLASIGVYDLDTLSGDVFHYDAVEPNGLRFVPLGLSPNDPDSELTPGEILEQHKTGQAYAHLLKPLERYPLLRDGEGTVLSMPPIINSESTRVTMDTSRFFIDVTGLSQRTVDRALNIVVTSLMEIMPAIDVECVLIEYPPGYAALTESRAKTQPEPAVVRITPDLTPTEMTLGVTEARQTIGAEINAAQLAELLESMNHGVQESASPDTLEVLVPAYRNDVMHPVDLIEDAAIAYGYENLEPRLVPTFTVGSPREIEERSTTARRVMTGLGFHQVMTLVLTSEAAAYEKWRIEPDERAVKIANPISVEQTMCRVSILPGLLETLAINKQYDLPQHLFETGDCCFVDLETETGAREERVLAACMIGTHVGYADIRAVADAFVHEMGAAVRIEPTEHSSYIPGRVAALLDAEGRRLGTMGEVHPEVLENYGLKHPVSVLELSLAKLLGM